VLNVKEPLDILPFKINLAPNLGLPLFNDALEGCTNMIVLTP